MQLASIGAAEKKKARESLGPALIPASQYRNHKRASVPQPEEPRAEPIPTKSEESAAPEKKESALFQPARAVIPKQPGAEKRTERVSGLSLHSIRAKKLHEARKKAKSREDEELPEDPVAEEELSRHWQEFAKQMEDAGKKILASSLSTDTPKLLRENTIWIELPNSTMKKEVERDQQDLMTYLKKMLNNYSLQLKVTVNEETARQYAFTPEEKYQKLREKNPAIDLLRKTFDLDL
jgi:DNA polymerase-3 subunit gamma/tau